MQSLPVPSLIVIQAAFLLSIFVKLLDDPTRMGQQDQALQGGIFGQDAEPVFDLLFFLLLRRVLSGLWGSFDGLGHGTFGQQPAFWPSVDAAVARATRRSQWPSGHAEPLPGSASCLSCPLATQRFARQKPNCLKGSVYPKIGEKDEDGGTNRKIAI